MFGIAPTKEDKSEDSQDLVGGKLKLNWLCKKFHVLPDNADEDELIRHTQAYMLHLIGGVQFTDHQGSQVHYMFMPLIHNFERCSKLSWGSGVFAFLYRELCKACKIGTEEIFGCILLSQLWAWTRLPTLAPVPRGPCLDNQQIWGDLAGPFGRRWCSRKSFIDVSSHVVSVNRLSLDVFTPNQFAWLPYVDILDKLPEHKTNDTSIWCYKAPLICFHIIEQHQADRCVRQFGMIQDVPSPPVVYCRDLHKITLKCKTDVNWRDKDREHINIWDKREQHVYSLDNFGIGVTNDYAICYDAITRPYHTRIAAAQSLMFNVLDRKSLMERGEIEGDIKIIDALATQGRQIFEYQFNRGLNQDFSCTDRLAKEELVRGKPKRAGHKGGRGGVNAPKRSAIQMDDERMEHVNEEGSVHLGDEDGDVGISMSPSNICVGEKSACIEDDAGTRNDDEIGNVDTTPPSSHATFQLLTPSPPAQEQPHHDEEIGNVDQTPPLSHPTFELLSLIDFRWSQRHMQHQQQPLQEQQLSVEQEQPLRVEQEQQPHLVEEQEQPKAKMASQ